MLWVTWRQHRGELVAAALFLVAVAVPLVVSGLAMREEFHADGVAACVADPGRMGCEAIVEQFLARHIERGQQTLWFALLPGVVGVFVGAPLLAREFEHGTWKLAFTQSVSRTRWLGTKLALVGGAAVVAAVLLGLMLAWWREPLDALGTRLRSSAFLVVAPSLAAVTLFAFAVGALAGAVLRRTILAMAATMVAFLVLRLSIEEYLRPHYLDPRLRITDPVTEPTIGWRPEPEWVVDSGWIDRAGHRLTAAEEWEVIRAVYAGGDAVYGAGTPVERYLADHGLRHFAEYHPPEAFWPLQLIESALFTGVAAALLAAAIWLVRRRTT